MAITQTQLETEIEAVKTYIDAGNYSAARVALVKAQLTMTAMPDYMLGGRSVHYRDTFSDLKRSLDSIEVNSAAATKNKRVFGHYYRG